MAQIPVLIFSAWLINAWLYSFYPMHLLRGTRGDLLVPVALGVRTFLNALVASITEGDALLAVQQGLALSDIAHMH